MSERTERSEQNKAEWAERKNELVALQNDVYSRLDPYRQREFLPPDLVNGGVLRRARGARTDADCIDEICELVAEGITVSAACKGVGVPKITWYRWKRENVANLVEKYKFALECHLDSMADATLDIVEELREQRRIALEQWDERTEKWLDLTIVERGDAEPPKYVGPTESDIRIAEIRVKTRQWHLEKRNAEYANRKHVSTNNTVSISQNLNVSMSPQEAMKEYLKMIEAKPI